MKALILAAGRGSRLGSLTAERPKGMLPLCGRTILDWSIASLSTAGIEDIALVGGYRHHMLSTYGRLVLVNERWETTNMVASLMCARAWVGYEPCIVSYSDIVYHPDHVRDLAATDADLAITYDKEWLKLWSARAENPLADAETLKVSPEGYIQDIGRKPSSLDEVEGQYMGLLKMNGAVLDQVATLLASLESRAADRLDMTTMLRLLMARGVPVQGVPIQGRWGEVDTEADAQLYERWSEKGPFWMASKIGE